MGKWSNDEVMDLGLEWLAANATREIFCTSQPATYAQATDPPASSGYALADVALGSGDIGAPGEGVVSGRKVAVAEKASIDIDASGTGTHVAIVNDDSSALMYVTTATSQAVTAGNKLTLPTWNIEIRDPA